MRENDDEILSRLILVGQEVSADRGLNAKRAEVRPGNAITSHAFGIGVAERRLPRADHRPPIDALGSFAELLRGEEADVFAPTISRSLPGEHETVWIGIGQRPQKHRIDDAEDRSRRTDRESERDDRGDGEGRRAAKLSRGVSHVAEERSHEGSAGWWVNGRMEKRGEGLPTDPPGAASLLFDDVADDMIGDGSREGALQKGDTESHHHKTLMTARVRRRGRPTSAGVPAAMPRGRVFRSASRRSIECVVPRARASVRRCGTPRDLSPRDA